MHLLFSTFSKYAPGIFLSLLITVLAYTIHWGEEITFNQTWLGPLVIAILVGTTLRSFWNMGNRWTTGIHFCSKNLLEIAIVLLGASITTKTLLSIDTTLLLGVIAIVLMAILLSFGIGKILKLPTKISLLIACGNSICGNSAIAAIAPIINATKKDITSSIAFTAIIGVVLVLTLPLFAVWFNMNETAYGIFAGLTVYAVPQVIAATEPLGNIAIETGTIVKLIRVLMLGPICLLTSLFAISLFSKNQNTFEKIPSITRLVPWFIIGFILMMACRSFELIPPYALTPLKATSTFLTTISMAALGLSVDIRTITQSGVRISTTVIMSLIGLGIISLTLLEYLNML
jgi:uncharacterized integral membrane protein (TIGR00698 family)